MRTQQELFAFAESVRSMLDPGLQLDDSGEPISEGSCLHASLLLCHLLNTFHGADVTADLRGGAGELNRGARGLDGFWYGHYWVEAKAAGGDTFVIDITADQFGFKPIYVALSADALGRYAAGVQREVDVAAVELAESYGDVSMAKCSYTRLVAWEKS